MADIQEQNQAAYQKQDKFSYRKVHVLGKKTNQRWYADIGLGIKTPEMAIRGKYIDKKCPFTSSVSVRGAILKGLVISTKMERTIIVRRDYLRYVKKYRRYEKRHRNIPSHCSPCFAVKEGDVVTIGQCRPLSKTVRFNVIEHEVQKTNGLSNIRKQFRMF
ncbi:RS11, ribosomal protein 11 40S small ribosomal subunit [Blastocystis sp. ATCC 50177/Nand II]|uniref:Small ribosomal subunit protein uS17 n=1 Tax=Blastocystis sp. subtype 1 (strain ATCC 50177 / NandII) TaxID=478820 RepID=A0A196SEL9_BLAHN|nr:RS11, ribosomal protein 11 40S small ribosomal subunit [Blastocystis sp. ATCC 50177/Nand II]